MFGLLYKELLTHKKQFYWILPLLVFFSLWVVVPPMTTPDLKDWELGLVLVFCSICTMLCISMFQQGVFEADEMKIWQSFIVSTPDGIHRQIGAKYVFNAAVSFIVVDLLLCMFSIAGAINDTDVSMYSILLILMLCIQLTIRAVETPFIVAFGSKHGNQYRMVLIMAVTLAAIVYGLFGDLSIFGSLADFLKWAKDFLTDNSSYFLRLTPAGALVLYYISYRISCLVYLKGGEYYDK